MDRTYKRFTESFHERVNIRSRTLRGLTETKDTFWALKGRQLRGPSAAEVLGIIGRSGAGKSTLLKILSRSPTRRGRGHHAGPGRLPPRGRDRLPPELHRPGEYLLQRRNPWHEKKREIDDKFDEIVKFSGVEKFLDTPVRGTRAGCRCGSRSRWRRT